MAVRLWSVLPKDFEANGLGAIERALMENPEHTHVVIAVLNRRRATIDDDAGDTTPTARVLEIEVLGGEQADAARVALAHARKTRTGSETLPFASGE
jgi:hypothetical protein